MARQIEDPALKLRQRLGVVGDTNSDAWRKLTPRERAEIAKSRLRAAAVNLNVQHFIQRKPLTILGFALGVGMILGFSPKARRAAVKTFPLMKSAIGYLR